MFSIFVITFHINKEHVYIVSEKIDFKLLAAIFYMMFLNLIWKSLLNYVP